MAAISGLPASALDDACAGTQVSRPVLRSEVLRIIRDEPVDVMITTGGATFLAGEEFLAAFAAREAPIAVLMATRRTDTKVLARLREAGVPVERIEFPIDVDELRDRVQASLRAAHEPRPQPDPDPTIAHPESDEAQVEEESMPNINKTLEEAMKIDGAIAAALADWESGFCLGTAGGGTRLNIEIAAAGNCQVVKAKMATMNELGIKGAIHDILITLDDQIHLIRPLRRGDTLFLYVAIDKVKGNLGLARHRLQKLEAELVV
ncbi:hypothetical protein [Nannocystis bainbridge]|uniref:Roadblock/LAMTOR2 domain-containing protein n=1 Tax=Nannocystis bainbridge TaxID=2995303 RepID=A0ABT5E3S8_9BACT|nr:hypothetical protein [Nannocystis bainbridge]MDC0720405.1 hypothetical protein [Nannocystis bainbridge]